MRSCERQAAVIRALLLPTTTCYYLLLSCCHRALLCMVTIVDLTTSARVNSRWIAVTVVDLNHLCGDGEEHDHDNVSHLLLNTYFRPVGVEDDHDKVEG